MYPQVREMPQGFGGLEYKDVTLIHPLALAAVLVLGLSMLFVSRKWAILPMLIIACFISSVQKIVIFGLDFNLLRIMVIFGACRLFLKKEYLSFAWNSIDTALVLWTISSTVFYTIGIGTGSAFINRLGFCFDAFGMYFFFRCVIKKWDDVDQIILGCIWIGIPIMLFFLLESRTGHNMFSIFGGVPDITPIRDGRLRCRGAFSHPILAGCFWAALMPLFAAQWWKSPKEKYLAVIGLVASSVIVICCASSTPVMGVVAGVLGGLLFYFRNYIRQIRWGILFTLVCLHLVMQAPVWHLISRISAVGGSTSWHRYNLINQAINHFDEWWLCGTQSTAHWGWGLQDVTNQYILEGVRGGFLTLCLFVAVIVFAFRGVGYLWRSQMHNSYHLAISWALGVSLFVHCMNFIGVSYFGQIYIIWYLLLAMIGSMSSQPGYLLLSKNLRSPLSLKYQYRRNV